MIMFRLVDAATVLIVVVVMAGCVRVADVRTVASPVDDATGPEALAGIIDQVYGQRRSVRRGGGSSRRV